MLCTKLGPAVAMCHVSLIMGERPGKRESLDCATQPKVGIRGLGSHAREM